MASSCRTKRKSYSNFQLYIFETLWISFILFSEISEAKTVEMSVVPKKMGSSWNHELEQQPSDTEESVVPNIDKSISVGEEEDDSYYDDDYSSEEIHCPRGMFYFLRSKMCVPICCYGGNKYRLSSGFCLPKRTVDHEIERKLYPGRFESVEKTPRRTRTPIELNSRTLRFVGRVGGKG